MKARKGNAYIMVMVATMAILLVVFTALTITISSRQMTGRYPDFYGLYDLAVAGNEHAIFLLNEDIWLLNEEELPYHDWYIRIEFTTPDGYVLYDMYEATTSIEPPSPSSNYNHVVKTVISKVVDGEPGHEVTVAAQISLDYYVYRMVQLMRQIN